MARQTISLQSPLSVDASGSSLEDVLPDDHAIDPSQHISDETVHRQLEQLLSSLSERERTILTMRFGLMGERVRTLQEISEHFNISRERVRQLEMQTLNKLRTPENMRIFGTHHRS
jgi:RNA polymerase primary sigma factor